MLVLKLSRYPRARPVIDDEYIEDKPDLRPWVEDDVHWLWRAQRWPAFAQPAIVDDELSNDGVPRLYEENEWSAQIQQVWAAPRTVVIDDGDIFTTPLSVDDEDAFAYRARAPVSRLIYPARRGGSTDNSQSTFFEDDPWLAITQRVWGQASPVTDDDVIGQSISAFGLDDEPAYRYRHRVPAWKSFYPARRGGSPDNNDPIVPIGIEDDPWRAQRQRAWAYSKAFIDDDPYVNTCAEDYLWIAIQGYWQIPLVISSEDEILPIDAQIGVDDADTGWFAALSVATKTALTLNDDEIYAIPPADVAPIVTNPADLPRGTAEWLWASAGDLYRAPDEVRLARERFGVIPKRAAEVITDVAQRQAERKRQLDERQIFEELYRELDLLGIEYEPRFLEALGVMRAQFVVEAEQQKRDDLEVLMLLMLAATAAVK